MTAPAARVNSRSVFRRGDRVRMTRLAHEYGINVRSSRDRLGTVTGFSRDGRYVCVRLDGNKQSGVYWPPFWEPAQ